MVHISKISVLFAAFLVGAGCSSSTSERAPKPDGGTGGAGTGGTTSGGVASCGSQACTVPPGAGIERITTCCTDENQCGLKLPEATKCLPANLPGYQTTDCPSYTSDDGGLQLVGCCSQTGCGALDAFVGCIQNVDVKRPAASCTYEPGSNCTSVTAVTCDGAEDCGKGQKCCGEFVTTLSGGAFMQFGCYDECPGTDGGGAVLWREMCHAGDSCQDVAAGDSCLTSTFLPPSLTRCYSAGEAASRRLNKAAHQVNCGTGVCAVGEKCCLRPPRDAYCAATNEECKCTAAADSGVPESLDAQASTQPDASMNPLDASSDARPGKDAGAKDGAQDGR